jgi:prepilin-type N-terminal cleavage/methylation domain-containing protein
MSGSMRRSPPWPGFRRTVTNIGARGFTAVEVLIAMTIMVIGAAAIMSMQKASVLGNLDARKTDIANSIARTWIERLQRDSMHWTLPSSLNRAGNNFNLAKLLNHPNDTWFLPTDYLGVGAGNSYGFDILGRDLAAGDIAADATKNTAGAQFCVEMKVTNLIAVAPQDFFRVQVRVVWPRGIGSAPAGFCTSVLGASPDMTLYHAIYVTTAVKENPVE